MFGLSLTGVVIALAAVTALLVVALLATRKPKRAEKWEKAAIMKQLLELSEQDEGLRRQAPAARMRTPVKAATKTTRSSVPMKTPAKTALSTHSKAR